MREPVLILGGRSGIGLAAAHHFAARGHPIVLAARDPGRLEDDRADIALRHGVAVALLPLDVLDAAGAAPFVAGLDPLPGIVICSVGLLGDRALAEADPDHATLIMRSNFEGPARVLGLIANRFARRGSGTIVGISSVAGQRGRATGHVYGAAKAGFTAYLSALRNRLAGQGVHVITVLPGFVDTAMLDGKTTPALLTAQPAEVARAIGRAVDAGRNVIHVRRIWWGVMAVICALPEGLFKRTRF